MLKQVLGLLGGIASCFVDGATGLVSELGHVEVSEDACAYGGSRR
jgi:hypothetical protein